MKRNINIQESLKESTPTSTWGNLHFAITNKNVIIHQNTKVASAASNAIKTPDYSNL